VFRPALLLSMLAAVLGLATSAGAAPAGLAPYHEPPWLVQRGGSPTLAYALLPRSATGTLYVRSDLRSGYTRIALHRGTYCPGDPADAPAMRRDKVCGSALLARVPASLTSGSKLFYYAVIKDHGRSVRVGTQRIWIVDRFQDVRLGTHRFGQFTAPAAIVARTGAADIGLACCADPPGGDGPSSLDVGRDGSTWVLDRLNHRLLVWNAGAPSAPARAVALPTELAVSDFALGRDGTIYARAIDTSQLGRGDKNHLYALTPSGKVRWKAPATPGTAISQLQLGPDGALYAAQGCGIGCAPFGGHVYWTPLTTPNGRPLSPAQRANLRSPFEPLPGGLRLVSEVSFSVARFALINRADEIVRAWKVTSATRLSGLAAAPVLVGGAPAIPFEVSNGRHWEKLVVRLGTTRRVTLPDRPIVGEVNLFAPLRLTSDGRIYQLRTSLTAGLSVARYSLR
jgi:hypothetical protein